MASFAEYILKNLRSELSEEAYKKIEEIVFEDLKNKEPEVEEEPDDDIDDEPETLIPENDKIFVTSESFLHQNGAEISDLLVRYDYDVVYNERGTLTEDDIIAKINELNAVGLLLCGKDDTASRKLMDSCPTLKVISCYGTGFENVDRIAANARGIEVVETNNAKDYESCADLAFGFIIALGRNITGNSKRLLDGVKNPALMTGDVWSQTLGIIGYGKVGHAIAKRAGAFKMDVLVYDPYFDPDDEDELSYVRFASFDEVMASSDYLCVCCAETEETVNLIDENALAMMKHSAYLINLSTGRIVNSKALLSALEAHLVAGAAVDCFEEKDIRKDILVKNCPENLIVTPNIASYTTRSANEINRLAMENLLKSLERIKTGIDEDTIDSEFADLMNMATMIM